MSISTTQPESASIIPLRQRMLEHMAMRGLRSHTQRDYTRVIAKSSAIFLGTVAKHTATHDVRRFYSGGRLVMPAFPTFQPKAAIPLSARPA